jgi:hypothetical protein
MGGPPRPCAWACSGAKLGPPPAAAIATAVASASTRPAGAMRHALVGVLYSIMPVIVLADRVNLVTRPKAVNETCDHVWVMKNARIATLTGK